MNTMSRTTRSTTFDATETYRTADPHGSLLVTFLLVAAVPALLVALAFPVATMATLVGGAVGLAVA